MDFGESQNSIRLTIRNTGENVLTWEIAAPSERWLNLSQYRGEATKLKPASVDVRVSREGLTEGVYEMTLNVISDGGRGGVAALNH